ncbi:MAG TPA: sulfurtransferase [Solirubrobacteraceae bacterium]
MARFLIVGLGASASALGNALEREGHVVSAVARPDRGALEHVAIVFWLERSSPERFLLRSVDSSMRGFVYQVGEHERTVLETARLNSIPVALLSADPLDRDVWLAHALRAIAGLLEARYVSASARYPELHIPKSRSAFDDELLHRRTDDLSGYSKNVLVDAAWLEQHLSDSDIRVVEVDENPKLYAEAHIPGAVGFDWKQDLQDPLKRDFLGPEDFGALFSRNGISSDHTIVLYGDRNNWFAAYTYWYLKYYGHEKVLLLDGPREKWIADGRPTTTDAPDHAPAAFVAKAGNEAIRARREEVQAAVGDSINLVDVRSPAEFTGEIISPSGYEQEGAQRAGHIPGAASIPWAQAVNEDGTFKSAEQLRELYGSKGVLDGKDIIAYCRIGERSAHTWFVLHELLGSEHVKNYDGSWTEWGSLVGVPVATGP